MKIFKVYSCFINREITYARQFRLMIPTIRAVGCFSDVRFSNCICLDSFTRTSSFSSSPSSPESSASSFFKVAINVSQTRILNKK